MANYAFLIDPIDTPNFWVDNDLSTSGEAVDTAESYSTSGVIKMDQDENGRDVCTYIPGPSIANIKIYFPE